MQGIPGMHLPDGPMTLGSGAAHVVTVGGFWMDAHAVTNAEFAVLWLG